METKLLTEENLREASLIIKNGGLVAIPTETVYGLSANALDGNAVSKIFKAKGRPMDNPLIVHISNINDIYKLVSDFPQKAKILAEKFWPGALTMVLPKSDIIPFEVSAGLETVAVRFPSHPVAMKFINECGCPLAAPSANLSGSPSPTTAQHVMNDMNGKIDAIIDGGESDVGLESTVISLVENPPRLLRPGGITLEDMESVIGHIEVDKAVLNKLEGNQKVASPGMKYKHYAPKAKVILVKGSDKVYINYVNSKIDNSIIAMCYDEDIPYVKIKSLAYGGKNDYVAQAHNLFSALREIDKDDSIKLVYARCPNTEGMALAIYNRIIRAAGFEIIDLSNKIIIGLTGTSGSGKSTVADIFKKSGCKIIDADLVARKVMIPPSKCLDELCIKFGDDILNFDGTLKRALLAQRAFSSKENTELLNSITHPFIVTKINNDIKQSFENGYNIVVVDAPQLFESKCNNICNIIVSVIAPTDIRLGRIIARDNITKFQAMQRMSAQHTDEFFKENCDYVINNNTTVLELVKNTEKLIAEIKNDLKV